MTKKALKPIVEPFSENEWRFLYPSSIDNEEVRNEFWSGVDLLDYKDREAESIFKRLISEHPYFLDAYNHLSMAFRNQKKAFESLVTAEKSYNLGKECLPKGFRMEQHKLIWACLSNRPFLRACQVYGLECQYHEKYEIAKKVYNEILRLNENDNQGIRYLLLEVQFLCNEINEARKLIDKYTDDFSIEFKFGGVVIEILEGDFKAADYKLKEAISTNKYFIQEIIKEKHIPPHPITVKGELYYGTGIPIGSTQEAYQHWKRNKKLYSKKKIIEYFKNKSPCTMQ